MRDIPNVTLVCVDCKNYGQALASLKKSLEQINPNRTLFLTDIDFDPKDDRITVVKIDKISSLKEYSRFIIKRLYQYIKTSHVLITQWDSWVLNGDLWTDEFFKYDMIGAVWGYKDGRNVGNLGFGLLSYYLLGCVANDNEIETTFPDDEILGRLYRGYLENKYNVSYAPEYVANQFSFELNEPHDHTFGFHSFFHQPFKDHIVIQRAGAMGDLIMCEPIMQYYHEQGYQVVLDTQPQFMELFKYHHFKVKHISQMHPDIKTKEVIDLNMAYELKPKMPVLEAYSEKSNIKIPLRNSRLGMPVDEKMFKKYAVIHCDSTGILHRDLNGIDWDYVVKNLEYRGYSVLQIGKRTKEEIALHFNTMTIEMLMFFLKGADLFIGLDSGNAQIAVALGVPSIILAGSVNLKYRYNDFSKIIPIQGKCQKEETQHCYHESVGSTTGQDCIYNKNLPPCSVYSAGQILDAINKLELCHTSVRQTRSEKY